MKKLLLFSLLFSSIALKAGESPAGFLDEIEEKWEAPHTEITPTKTSKKSPLNDRKKRHCNHQKAYNRCTLCLFTTWVLIGVSGNLYYYFG